MLLPLLFLFELLVFTSQLTLSPQLLIRSFFYSYFQNIRFFLCKCLRITVNTQQCSLCDSEDWSYCSLQEEYLIKEEAILSFRFLVGTPCGHIFHKECLKKHIARSRNCPVDAMELPVAWIYHQLGMVPIQDEVSEIVVQMPGGEEE